MHARAALVSPPCAHPTAATLTTRGPTTRFRCGGTRRAVLRVPASDEAAAPLCPRADASARRPAGPPSCPIAASSTPFATRDFGPRNDFQRRRRCLVSQGTTLNAFYYGALRAASTLAGLLGHASDAATYAADATTLQGAMVANLWNVSGAVAVRTGPLRCAPAEQRSAHTAAGSGRVPPNAHVELPTTTTHTHAHTYLLLCAQPGRSERDGPPTAPASSHQLSLRRLFPWPSACSTARRSPPTARRCLRGWRLTTPSTRWGPPSLRCGGWPRGSTTEGRRRRTKWR